ncbi:glycosyltransferase [Pigmentiphaga soli]|uniref:Glycosyltransferase n=1 Tax=Pigmentiphaga soli TaxID=1007095 RepID=A0ABP8H321_9BURK
MLNLTVSFIASLVINLFIVRYGSGRRSIAADSDLQGVQKFHTRPVPRIGGLAIMAACWLAVAALWPRDGYLAGQLTTLLLASLIAFASGLAEDITKKVRPFVRLIATAAAALLGCTLAGAIIPRVDVALIDGWMAHWPVLAVVLSVVCVAGMVNAVNIIDGFNGLASVTAILMFMSLGYVAFKVGDPFVLGGALIMIGAILGFFLWNYPNGMVFLGDGGAYLLGFVLAELGILLVARNPQVSAWYPALLFIYPIFETVFSIYRKKYLRGISPGVPDGVHLHMLIYKRVIRWAIGKRNARVLLRRNAMTSPYLWALALIAVMPATIFWAQKYVLVGFLLGFILVYCLLYRAIVRFRTPKWLVLHRTH